MLLQISLWRLSRFVVGLALTCAAAISAEPAAAAATTAGTISPQPPVMVLVHGASGGGWQLRFTFPPSVPAPAAGSCR